MMQFLLASSTPGDLVLIVLPWVVAPIILAVAYAKTKRWDRSWKERWEHRHAASLETLRHKKQRTLKAVTVVQRVVLAVFFMTIGFGLWPVLSAIRGVERELASIIALFAAFSTLVLLGFAVFTAGTMLLRYQLNRIDELLSAETKR
jgi:hypothetical protein